MPDLPRDQSLDSTLALLRDPYGFISKRCQRYRSDVFQARLLFKPAIFMTGPSAAELFYDERRFARSGVAPGRIQKTLFGRGGVQGLDDAPHRHRKRMFLSLMAPERLQRLAEIHREWWSAYARQWTARDRIVLYPAAQEILTQTVCAWAGVPLAKAEVKRRSRDLAALFDQADSFGPKHWQARLARRRTERWISGFIEDIRAGRFTPPAKSAAHLIAWHRELNGELLSPRIAAVELINVLRPTVAVAVYIVFAALALHQHPECRAQLAAGDGDAEHFVQEVRRFYPFFPLVAARVREDFEWRGYPFPAGRLVLLDLHGTNHDARTWERPDAFWPERFRTWDGSAFNFIPQGGGSHERNHRCPGEWITIELMKVAAQFLTGRLAYEVPPQDLRIERSRLPALPRSRFVIRAVSVKVNVPPTQNSRSNFL